MAKRHIDAPSASSAIAPSVAKMEKLESKETVEDSKVFGELF